MRGWQEGRRGWMSLKPQQMRRRRTLRIKWKGGERKNDEIVVMYDVIKNFKQFILIFISKQSRVSLSLGLPRDWMPAYYG